MRAYSESYSLQNRFSTSMRRHVYFVLVAETVLAPGTNFRNPFQIFCNSVSYLIHYSLETESFDGWQLQLHLSIGHCREPLFFLHSDNVPLLRTRPSRPRIRPHNHRLAECAASSSGRFRISMSRACRTIELSQGGDSMSYCRLV